MINFAVWPHLLLQLRLALAHRRNVVRGSTSVINPFLPTVPTFAVRETDVSRHNGGTSEAPLKPLRDDSALNWSHPLLQLRLALPHLRNVVRGEHKEALIAADCRQQEAAVGRLF